MFKKKRNRDEQLSLIIDCIVLIALILAMLGFMYVTFKILATGTFL